MVDAKPVLFTNAMQVKRRECLNTGSLQGLAGSSGSKNAAASWSFRCKWSPYATVHGIQVPL